MPISGPVNHGYKFNFGIAWETNRFILRHSFVYSIVIAITPIRLFFINFFISVVIVPPELDVSQSFKFGKKVRNNIFSFFIFIVF